MCSLSSLLLALAAVTFLPARAADTYKLVDLYNADNFNDEWTFFSQADPTNGYVKYVSSNVAESSSSPMAGKTASGNIMLDSQEGTNGRQSIRVTSKKSYQYHLMIADIVHAPQGSGKGGSCGLWPALWELGGPDPWPAAGELDIYEGVNGQTANQMTLHTDQNCQMQNNKATFSGNMTSTDCNVANGANGNLGCAVVSQGSGADSSFGAGFNAAGGGVYAAEVDPQGIKIWHFPRGSVPQDISVASATPDPSTWGLPAAAFSGACDIGEHFKNLQIVVNTAFCGDWAGKVWAEAQNGGAMPSCAQLTGAASCDAYVAANPDAFVDAYWEIGSIKVYSPDANATATATAGAAASKRDESKMASPSLTALRTELLPHKRQPQQTANIFSQPTGDALQSCQQLTPGHCGQDKGQAAASNGAAAAAAAPSANLLLMAAVAAAIAVAGSVV